MTKHKCTESVEKQKCMRRISFYAFYTFFSGALFPHAAKYLPINRNTMWLSRFRRFRRGWPKKSRNAASVNAVEQAEARFLLWTCLFKPSYKAKTRVLAFVLICFLLVCRLVWTTSLATTVKITNAAGVQARAWAIQRLLFNFFYFASSP